jgi:Na+/melibiose symporter-like transporter
VPKRTARAPILSHKPNLSGVRSAILGAEDYRALWVSYVCQMVGISVNAALLPYTVYLAFRSEATAVATIFAIMTVATLAAMPLAVVAARRLGTVTAYVMSLIVSAVGLVVLATGQPLLLWPALVGAAVFGLGQAGATSLPFAMLPQALDKSDRDLARANAGALTGLWVAGEKLGLAIGAAMAGVLLSAIGYDSAAPDQQAGTIAAIPWLFGPLPAAFMLLSALLLRPLLPSTLNCKAST